MQSTITPWPKSFPRVFRPMARFSPGFPVTPDMLAVAEARRRHRQSEAIRNSFLTGTVTEQMFVNISDYTAFNTSSAEGSLLAGGSNEQPIIPATFFANKQGHHRAIRIEASGVLGTTSTPTVIFQVRLGTTSGSTFLSGTSVGVSAAITTASGVTNKWWQLCLDLQCNTVGIGTGNTTLSGAGYVMSPGGFASPFIYALEPTTPDTATWTATIDNSLTYYVNVSATWSSSSASNTITCKRLGLWGFN